MCETRQSSTTPNFLRRYRSNSRYALTPSIAPLCGATVLALCAPTGSSGIRGVKQRTGETGPSFPSVMIGIHTHDDLAVAVANALAAICAGAITPRARSLRSASAAATWTSSRSSPTCSSITLRLPAPGTLQAPDRSPPLRLRVGDMNTDPRPGVWSRTRSPTGGNDVPRAERHHSYSTYRPAVGDTRQILVSGSSVREQQQRRQSRQEVPHRARPGVLRRCWRKFRSGHAAINSTPRPSSSLCFASRIRALSQVPLIGSFSRVV